MPGTDNPVLKVSRGDKAAGTPPRSDFEVTGAKHATSRQAPSFHESWDGTPLPVGIAGGGDPQSELDFALEPLGSLTISTDGQGTATPGSALVTADQELGGVIRFTISGIGVAGVGQSDPLPGFISPVRRSAGGISTGLALENVEDYALTVVLELRDESGEVVAERTLEDFPARGHLSEFIEQIFPAADTDDFRGTVTVRALEGRIAGTAIELDVVTKQFTTLPVTPLK